MTQVHTKRPRWRVGTKVPINVYEGDRPVCQCHNEDDASRIVKAMNDTRYWERRAPQREECED